MQENKTQNLKKTTGKKILTIIIAVLLFTLTFIGGYFSSYLFRSKPNSTAFDIITLMEKVGYIYDPVTGEEREITQEEIADAIVNAYLDKHSAYFTEEEYNEYQSQGKGNYSGVGLSFYKTHLIIDEVIGNSPAEKAGLKKGDVLISGKDGEQGQTVVFTSYQQMTAFLSDCQNDVYLTYNRNGTEHTAQVQKGEYIASYVWYYDSEKKLSFTATGRETPKATVTENTEMQILNNKIAYIKLSSFEGDSFEQMASALEFMKERGRTRLILDLMDNGGGYLDTATKIASCFINNGGSKKSVVAVAKGKTGEQVFTTDKNRYFPHIERACVLVNDNTASASECLLGVLCHYRDVLKDDNDIILEKNANGEYKSYGKGIMQSTYKLLSGGALKLTTAKIYWPDGQTSIHGKGVTDGTRAEKGQALTVALQRLA